MSIKRFHWRTLTRALETAKYFLKGISGFVFLEWILSRWVLQGNTILHLQPGRTLIIISDVWYQDKAQICWECVSPGSKNTEAVRTVQTLVTAPASLPFLWERKTEAAIYILFSMAAELWTRSLFASSNKFKCNQVLFKGRHSSCEQAGVHNVLCTVHFWLSSCRLSSRCRGCLFSNSSGIMRECSPDAAALRPFIWRRLLLTYIHLHRARPFKSCLVKQEGTEVAAKLSPSNGNFKHLCNVCFLPVTTMTSDGSASWKRAEVFIVLYLAGIWWLTWWGRISTTLSNVRNSQTTTCSSSYIRSSGD